MQRCFILLCAFVKLISILVFRVMCHQTMSVSRTFLDVKTSNRNWSYFIILFIPENISNLTIIFEYDWWCGSTHRKYHLWSSTCILSTHASGIYNNMIFHEKLICKPLQIGTFLNNNKTYILQLPYYEELHNVHFEIT